MNDLNHLAQQYFVSIERLRQFAVSHCGIDANAPQGQRDLWLYERLATAVFFAGAHFCIDDEEAMQRMVDYSTLWFKENGGSFLERCAESWAELQANPIVRHEILLHKPFRFEHAIAGVEAYEGGALHEPFSDVLILR